MSGTRITVPPLKIDLDEDGFDGVCKLDRKSDGKKLSELVERISEPLVIALDAPWGAGKSVFLQCWVGEHRKPEHAYEANTLYFDAFKHDFLDDPLIALTGAISERFSTGDAKSEKWQRAKNAASKLARPAVRILGAVASAGATEVAGVLVDAALEAGSKELQDASEKFWAKENGKRAAMKAFRTALKDLAADQKLVIVIDELDRCRPDYALNLLEVIKHFFDVDNVHFVLGVNLKELENSVRARYGSKVNAAKYLQRFYNVHMSIGLGSTRTTSKSTLRNYYDQVAEQLHLEGENYAYSFQVYFRALHNNKKIGLRDVNRIITEAMISPKASGRSDPLHRHLSAGAIVLKVVAPEALEKLRNGTLNTNEVLEALGLTDDIAISSDSELQKIQSAWQWATLAPLSTHPGPTIVDLELANTEPKNRESYIRAILRDSVDTFNSQPPN